jgi:hypothetical protein
MHSSTEHRAPIAARIGAAAGALGERRYKNPGVFRVANGSVGSFSATRARVMRSALARS